MMRSNPDQIHEPATISRNPDLAIGKIIYIHRTDRLFPNPPSVVADSQIHAFLNDIEVEAQDNYCIVLDRQITEVLGGEYDDGEHIFQSEGALFDVQPNGLQTSTDTSDWSGFQFDMVSVL